MNYFDYQTSGGYIHNWLVAGPRVLEVPELERFYGYDFRLRIARHYDTRELQIAETPVERARFTVDG